MKLNEGPQLHPYDCKGCRFCTGVDDDTPSPPASHTPTVPSPPPLDPRSKRKCRGCGRDAGRFLGLCDWEAKLYMPPPTTLGPFELSVHLPHNPYAPIPGVPQEPLGRPMLMLRSDTTNGPPIISSEQAHLLAHALTLYAKKLEQIESEMEVP
jgi:hypothetical protein